MTKLDIGDRVQVHFVVSSSYVNRRDLIRYLGREGVVHSIGDTYRYKNDLEFSPWDPRRYTYRIWYPNDWLHVTGYYLEYLGSLSVEERATHPMQVIRDTIHTQDLLKCLD